ncbi:MAG: GerMN domain-containing protein [Candidatus Firestonebacteria bacterium]|nr:GerMN domain-containing protein [Candidatus Firestonebacteria bacterium]
MSFIETAKNKKAIILLLIVILLLTIILLYKLWPKHEDITDNSPPLFTSNEEIINISLYFGSEDDDEFVIESREIYKTKILINQAKQSILKLMEGPKTDKATKIIPDGTKLRELYLEEGRAYVDFSKEISENHPGGSKAETATINSIVNTLIRNFSEIKEVQILIEGKIENTLAGHIDIRQPFKAKGAE